MKMPGNCLQSALGQMGLEHTGIDEILLAAINAVNPKTAVKQFCKRDGQIFCVGQKVWHLDQFRRIRLVGAGKASVAMAEAVIELLYGFDVEGVVVSKEAPQVERLGNVKFITGDHPIPGAKSLAAGQEAAQFLHVCEPEDLVICLISGGGSSLITLPQPGITLDDIQGLTNMLLRCGATIQEINSIRKHTDVIKGGGLVRLVNGAQIISLILSDVIGNPLDIIASGPTVPDESTFKQALMVLEKYGVFDETPHSIRERLLKGSNGDIAETLKMGDKLFDRVTNILIGSNYLAARAAKDEAGKRGFQAAILSTYYEGEAKIAGRNLAGILRQMVETGDPFGSPACVIVGGETTVTIRGKGLGGRNLELALGAVELLAGLPNCALITLATDGEDGITGAAGAIVTGETMERANSIGIYPGEYLKNNDSYHFFQQVGGLIRTGSTGTNVNDLTFLFLLPGV